MALKVAINGLGRIGRCVAKIISKRQDIDLVAVNASGDEKTIEYILKYDSVHRNKNNISVKDGFIYINSTKSKLISERKPSNINFAKYGAEVVLDCTGAFLTKELVNPYIKNGIKKVIFSAPAKDDSPTFIIGANEEKYKGEKIISNSSCTTNGLAPIIKIIDKNFGITNGLMTTIHSYTSSQSILDTKSIKDPRKGRAAAINLIPTSTGAAKSISKIFPHLEGKLNGLSIRVPTPNVSLLDITLNLKEKTTINQIIEVFKNAKNNSHKNIIDLDEEYKVSQDFIGDEHSSIIIKDKIQIIEGTLLKIISWYDNEWGYSSRLVDMALYVSK